MLCVNMTQCTFNFNTKNIFGKKRDLNIDLYEFDSNFR